jgi:hypothetical protein
VPRARTVPSGHVKLSLTTKVKAVWCGEAMAANGWRLWGLVATAGPDCKLETTELGPHTASLLGAGDRIRGVIVSLPGSGAKADD